MLNGCIIYRLTICNFDFVRDNVDLLTHLTLLSLCRHGTLLSQQHMRNRVIAVVAGLSNLGTVIVTKAVLYSINYFTFFSFNYY